MQYFIGLLAFIFLLHKCDLSPNEEKKGFGENFDLTREEYYDSLEKASIFLEKCCVNSNVYIEHLEHKLKQDTVIFKSGDTLWGTLGIKNEDEAIEFAKRFSFKYFFDDWGELIVLVPKDQIFIKGWYPIDYDFESFKKEFVKI